MLVLSFAALAKTPSDEITKLLPREIGAFRQVSPIRPNERLRQEALLNPEATNRHLVGGEAEYLSPDGARLLVEVARFSRDSDAYSLLTITAASLRNAGQGNSPTGTKLNREIGTASLTLPGRVSFFKGRTFIRVSENDSEKNSNGTTTLARLIADRLEKGEGDIPVLVKHLPQWEEAQERVLYLAGFTSLKGVLPNQPLLEAVRSEGDADAVATSYGNLHFLVVEFNTPQLAGDNDRNITAKIQELRGQGQAVPSAYRRVGNYSVFVFDAPSEQEANGLIDKIEYAQIVQWLGDNPYLLEKAQRDYYQTTAGVLVAVVKASGLSLLACLAAGGFLGALLFNRRRAQQRNAEAFSDAGGMLRLNIDEMTPESDPARLLGHGNRS
ncbi:MAG: DUF6599 family protein [Pyrinomonadaceae bacterium]